MDARFAPFLFVAVTVLGLLPVLELMPVISSQSDCPVRELVASSVADVSFWEGDLEDTFPRGPLRVGLARPGPNVGEWRFLIRFGLPPLSEEAIISNARLALTLKRAEGQRESSVTVAYLFGEWDENTVTAKDQPTAQRFVAADVGTQLIEYTWDVSGVVRDWYNGVRANNGFLVLPTNYGAPNRKNDLREFLSREGADSDKLPRLLLDVKECPPPSDTPMSTEPPSATATSISTNTASPALNPTIYPSRTPQPSPSPSTVPSPTDPDASRYRVYLCVGWK